MSPLSRFAPFVGVALLLGAAGWLFAGSAVEGTGPQPEPPAVLEAPPVEASGAEGVAALSRIWAVRAGSQPQANQPVADSSEGPLEEWRFAGMVADEEGAAALFVPQTGGEGRLVRVGEALPDGAVIAEIHPTRVVFEGGRTQARLFSREGR